MAKASKVARLTASIDADEAGALEAAALVLQTFARVENPEAVTSAVISRWIIERMKTSVGKRLTDNVVFDLHDAKLQGIVEATLPNIAEMLSEGGFDFARSFGELSKEEAVQLFLAPVIAHRVAAVAAGESPDFPFSDPIPFGGDA